MSRASRLYAAVIITCGPVLFVLEVRVMPAMNAIALEALEAKP